MDPFTNLLIVVSMSSHDNQYAIWILTVIPHVRIIPLVTSTCNRTPFLDLAGKFGVTFSDDDALCAEFLGHGSRMGHEQYGDILLRHDLVHAFLAFPGKLAVTDR